MNTPRPKQSTLLMVAAVSSLRSQDKALLLRRVADPDVLCSLSHHQVEQIIRRPLRTPWNPVSLSRLRERGEWWLSSQPHRHILWIDDANYPESLRLIHDPPAVLFAWGNLAALQYPRVAVVGTRRPSEGGRRGAAELGSAFAATGVAVVSGLARGIDGDAHRGVVAAQEQDRVNAPAIAVLGSGIDHIYPREHRPLAVDIIRNGGVILSEYPPGFPPRRYQFPARNRIVVGLSPAVVVVQAPAPSGALISAEFALSEGRDVLVHQVGASWSGCQQLLESGAALVQNATDAIAAVEMQIGNTPSDLDRILFQMQHQKLSLFRGIFPAREEQQ